ncbi:16S rRNA (uracil(1498)-N(3))-methyltransferase [Mesobacillus zeae]|uniref:Ribosomal RNA small subunit methyltransferase E n=1 Tax=Mesobacillus zeae TaxID=1917180 RepID=A0A398B7V9_9BACI|nr:16S rRNA (uracil(1498)-N(3))-methyltransferase [Mesobacillus zeae]RID83796.1 16S rRNA (uracil(1498)-N(3))-methyltransferase [Mesobacillus zeae]
MQRYFAKQGSEDGRFTISGDDARHIAKVMRMEKGDRIFCVSPDGRTALCEIENITGENVEAAVVKWEEGSSELPILITIASGLPKGDKLEYIIQKGTELGAFAFVPFIASRSVVKWDEKKAAKKTERLMKIAKEAAEQSHRSHVPDVASPTGLKELAEMAKSYSHKLVAYEEEAKRGEKSALAEVLGNMSSGQTLFTVFGPEGGLSEQEVSFLKEQGFRECSLGPRILRTETAPLYLLSAASYQTELMR